MSLSAMEVFGMRFPAAAAPVPPEWDSLGLLARECRSSAGWVLTLAGPDCSVWVAAIPVDLSLYVCSGRARLMPCFGGCSLSALIVVSLPLEDELPG